MAARKTAKKAKKTEGLQSVQELSFEDALERLSKIVEELEGGELTLEESLACFEEGVTLSHQSQLRLNSAESRVEELLRVEEDGTPVVAEFSPENEENDEESL